MCASALYIRCTNGQKTDIAPDGGAGPPSCLSCQGHAPVLTAPAKTAGPAAAIRIEVILSSLLQVAADLKTSEELVACYKEQPLATSRGVCKVRSIAGGGIK